MLTQQGLRVLAVAHRTLHMPWHKAERVQRSAAPPPPGVWCHECVACRSVVEAELTFAGLIVMQNKLKPQTTPTIRTLTSASIRTVMVTGEWLCVLLSALHSLKPCCFSSNLGRFSRSFYSSLEGGTEMSFVSFCSS